MGGLAHLARRDLVLFACLAVFEETLWFVPGLRARCRELRAETEVCVAKQHFFLRFEDRRFTASLDGVHFGGKRREPGTFFMGFVAGPDGTMAKIDIETPTADMAR